MNRCRRPTALAGCLLLLLVGAALLSASSAGAGCPQLTLTLGKKPVYIEPAGQVPPGEPPAQPITQRAFGVNAFRAYNRSGFTYTLSDQIAHLGYLDIGFHRMSLSNNLTWGAIQGKKSAGYALKPSDTRFSRLTAEAGVELMVTVGFYAKWDQDECHEGRTGPMYPCNIERFLDFLRAAVERYDGDADYGCRLPAPDCYVLGDGKYPKWSAARRPAVKLWQVGNELDLPQNWSDTPERYATLLTQSCQTIKAACPDCRVLMAGESSSPPPGSRIYPMHPFYKGVIESLQGQYFDIIDNHLYKRQGDYNLYRGKHDEYLAALAQKGFTNVEFWMTEIGTYSGLPRTQLGFQSEEDQAGELVKRYVYAFASGVKKVCWPKIMENYKFNNKICDYQNFTGLINNPNSPDDCTDPESPAGFGADAKKLAYYTYKLLIEKLKEGDWAGLDIVQEADNVYIYRFRVQGHPVYVVWWDWFRETGEGRSITLDLSDMPTGSVTITEAVPNAASGAELSDEGYPLFFNATTVICGDETP